MILAIFPRRLAQCIVNGWGESISPVKAASMQARQGRLKTYPQPALMNEVTSPGMSGREYGTPGPKKKPEDEMTTALSGWIN